MLQFLIYDIFCCEDKKFASEKDDVGISKLEKGVKMLHFRKYNAF